MIQSPGKPLFSVGLDQALEAPGYHEWSSSFLYSLLGIRLVLSMGFVGIKFIVPNLRLIPCFDGLCSSASHYPWTVFDARTEGGRHFFHSLLWNTEHLVIFRIYYTPFHFYKASITLSKVLWIPGCNRVLVSLFWISPNGLALELQSLPGQFMSSGCDQLIENGAPSVSTQPLRGSVCPVQPS